MADAALLDMLDSYYDAVPRGRATAEEIGPFTLFVAKSGWPYYARPSRSAQSTATTDDVRQVLARQQELGVPQNFEWVAERSPDLAETVEAAGIAVLHCPLLVLQGAPRGDAGTARMLGTDDLPDIAASNAAITVGFSNAGTGTGSAGIEARDTSLDSPLEQVDDTMIARIEEGSLRFAAVYDPAAPALGPVGGGSHSPVDNVTEIAGVAVLPAYRRRGMGAQLTYVLATDALRRGVTTVFCSAASDDVARVYAGIGFERVATACIAEAGSPGH